MNAPLSSGPLPAAAADPRATRLAKLLALSQRSSDVDARLALEQATEAGALARELGDERGRGEALYWEGCARDHLLEHDRALAAYEEALAIARTRGDGAAQARVLCAIGYTYDELGDFPQALDHHLRALELEQAADHAAGRAATLRAIGVVYSRSGDLETGLDYFRKSLDLCMGAGDDVSRAKTLNNIGVNLNDLGRHQESLGVLERALAVYHAEGLTLQQSGTLVNLGLTLQKLGRVADAETSFRDASRLAESTGHRFGAVDAQLSLGRLAAAQGRTGTAREQLEAALAGAELHRLKQAACECHDALAALHEREGHYREALAHYRRFHDLERDVMMQSSQRQLKAVQTRYQLTAAQREAEIHRLRHVELAEANAELEQLNNSLRAADEQKSILLGELERQTYEDSLTGLGNRRLLDKRFNDEFDRAVRHARPLAVALIDIDHFKRINDRYSHAIGDAALRELARRCASAVRHTDLVVRLGGEEFVLVLVETDADAAWTVCEKLRLAIATHDWKQVHSGMAMTVSIGFSADTTAASAERMLAAADRNLYVAKSRGRNCVVGDDGAAPA